MRALVLDRYASGDRGVVACELDTALARHWSNDAHVTQYEAPEPPRRIVKAEIRERPMRMLFEMFDYDCPNHEPLEQHPEFAEALMALPTGWRAYLTAGGFRVWRLLDVPFTVDSPEAWETWRARHAGTGLGLDAVLGVSHDPACDDPSRIFRLPNVTREGGKPCYPEVFEGSTDAVVVPQKVPPKAATECVEGDADASLVALVLKAAKIEQCPWEHEHTSPGGTVIFPTEDGLGVFHCAHSHCKGRHTHEVVEALKDVPAVRVVLERWGYLRPQIPMAAAEAKTSIVLPKGMLQLVNASALAKPLGEVPWLIEGLDFAPGRPMIVGGAAGSGKTYALQEMALRVAGAEGDVWDYFPVARHGRVLHIDVDQGQWATSHRYQLLARGMKVDLATLPLECAFFDFALSKKDGISLEAARALRDVCKGRTLCIVDSLRGVAPGLDEQDSAFGEVLQVMSQISGETGCAFVVVAHSGHDQNRARGTSAIQDRGGSIFQLTYVEEAGSEGLVTWEQKKRSEYGQGAFIKFQTRMNRAPDGLNPKTVIQAEDIEVPAKPQTPQKLSPATEDAIARAKIIEYIKAEGRENGCSLRVMRGKVSIGNAKIAEVCQRLCEEGTLDFDGRRYLMKRS